MPNRYGEPPQPDEPRHEPQTATPTTDHQAAAQRGMNTIRAIMGWKTPQNPAEDQPDGNNNPPTPTPTPHKTETAPPTPQPKPPHPPKQK